MKNVFAKIATPVLGFAAALWVMGPAPAEAQERGGILKYVIPSNPPSADGHRETTFFSTQRCSLSKTFFE